MVETAYETLPELESSETHALVYRARLGEPDALDAARALAAEIDNPALDELLASAELSAAA